MCLKYLLYKLYYDLDGEEKRISQHYSNEASPCELSATESIFVQLYKPSSEDDACGWLVGPMGERPLLACLLHAGSLPDAKGSQTPRNGVYDAVRWADSFDIKDGNSSQGTLNSFSLILAHDLQ